MPLASAMQDLIYLPAVTTSISPGGVVTETWSFVGVEGIPCRFAELSTQSIARAFGQGLDVDATALVDGYNVTYGPDTLNESSTPEARQVKIKIKGLGVGSLYEVKKVRDLGGIGRVKEFSLSKWKV